MNFASLKLAFTVLAVGAVSGCQVLGPQSINAGRADYNEAIQETSKQQGLGNIVRVYKRQPVLFMDVTEVSATSQIQASVLAGLQVSGAPTGTTRTRTNQGTLQYQETPLIRYVPVIGSALTMQVATPISVDSLAFLSDSNWPITPLLTLAVNYVTPGYADLYSALNAIFELYEDGALLVAQSKSDMTASAPGSATANIPLNDSMVLYLVPGNPLSKGADATETRAKILRLWIRLLRIYAGTQPQTNDPDLDAKLAVANLDKVVAELDEKVKAWNARRIESQELETFLAKQFRELRNWIELRMAPVVPSLPVTKAASPGQNGKEAKTDPRKTGCVGETAPKVENKDKIQNCTYLGPLMRTRSALGILKAATEPPGPMIEFIGPEKYTEIRKNKWQGPESTHYTLTLAQEDPASNVETSDQDKAVSREVSAWIEKEGNQGKNLFTFNVNADVRNYVDVKRERRLGRFRRFLLVIVADAAPKDAYVTFPYQGKTYYIAGDDQTSQRNFNLLTQFTIMQATPSPSALTPTISVGGK